MKSRLFICLILFVLIAFLVVAFFPDASALAVDERDVLVPAPMSPHGTLLDRTPTYKWSKVTGATTYQFQIYKGTVKILDNSTSAAICGATDCSKTPSFTLGYNIYKWRVRAYKTTWSAWSSFKTYTITPPSFTSNFTMSFCGWAKKAGANWNLYDGYMYTPGTDGEYSSAYYTKGQYTNFDYSARLRVEHGQYGSPCIVFRMGTNVADDKEWFPGYSFCYMNNQTFMIGLTKDDGTHIKFVDYKNSDKIIPYEWNILRVVAKGSKFYFYINGTFVGLITNSYRSRGYIGVMAKQTNYYEELDVDWAMMKVIETPQ